ncbi:MAG: primosomal protein N' [Porticoccus sp.]|jgi:primosomal protein N' (replication factor Y)|uniref:primosomal protein N' n=2 Tax=Porticoccus sp. TaxID=2024853 RepID=UPI00329A21BA|tara:strand:- start:817343 stop:819553 length:2211 start_codon:yes stop_codon:yes gene_type:complete
MTESIIIRVAVPSPLRRLFDYLPSENNTRTPRPGCRVKVPFGRRQVIGVVIEIAASSEHPATRLKPVTELLDDEPLLPETLLALCVWAAGYYQHPTGDALSTALPATLRKGDAIPRQSEVRWQLTLSGKGLPDTALARAPRQQQALNILQQQPSATKDDFQRQGISIAALRQLESKGLIESLECRVNTPLFDPDRLLSESPLPLYPEQQQAMDSIELHGFHAYLLDGQTGSGKTEIYLQAIEKVIRYGRQALVLIPEISLTPQTLDRFKTRFNCPVAVLHSGLTDRERVLAWDAARTGTAPIVLGTRSAIFTPLASPGILIVDEEHDGSFKQQEGFRYSARDLAVVRARMESIPLILGSATPSLETRYNCEQQRYTRLVLSCRPGVARQPRWQPVDIRKANLSGGYSRELIDAIQTHLDDGNQVLVFLNRRGFAPTLTCHECGWIADCPHCEARLTVHRQVQRLVCHHCEFRQPVPPRCPVCHSIHLQCLGQGTERSEETLEALFPDFPVIRVDRDSTRRKQAMQNMVDRVHQGEPCILLGTQLLAKGHHFPNVTLVAILDADAGLFSPDFRAPERMGQLITQVAGRAGRGDKPGTVILQSHHCDHPLLTTLTRQDYATFSDLLMAERKLANLPPFGYLALLRGEAENGQLAVNFLSFARQQAEMLLPPTGNISYLGPLPAPMERRGGRFRHQLTICAAERPALQQLLATLCPILEQSPLAGKIRWSLDIDPQDMS